MPLTRRAALALAAARPTAARAQGSGWSPFGPIRVIVPQPAAASMDLAARQLARLVQADLGQPVVVENRTGAGTLVGTQAASCAAPDGHTLLIAANSFIFHAALQTNVSYDPLRDFVPIALLTVVPHVLVAQPRLGANFVGFVEAARRPGAGLSYGS